MFCPISLGSLEIEDGMMLREKRNNRCEQEDDLFSTYESLKAHASPSPPPALLWTDLSKDEKKTLGKAKSPCSENTVVVLTNFTIVLKLVKNSSNHSNVIKIVHFRFDEFF